VAAGDFSVRAPAAKPAEQESFYTGTGFAVTEILLSMNELQAKLANLRQGNSPGSAVQQKLAAEAISRVAGQIKTMADTIARVTIAHLNRKPRV
jgi:hypothetical protein